MCSAFSLSWMGKHKTCPYNQWLPNKRNLTVGANLVFALSYYQRYSPSRGGVLGCIGEQRLKNADSPYPPIRYH
jgi:hypothetical protein